MCTGEVRHQVGMMMFEHRKEQTGTTQNTEFLQLHIVEKTKILSNTAAQYCL